AHAAQREQADFAAHEDDDRELLCTWYLGLDTRLDDRPDAPGITTAVEDGLLRRAMRLSASGEGSEADSTAESAELLGEYAPEGRPRTAALAAALAAASDVHRLAGPALADPVRRSGPTRVLCAQRPATAGLLETAACLRAECADWESFTQSPALTANATALRAHSFPDGAAWLRSQ